MNLMTSTVLKSFQDLYVSKLAHKSATLKDQLDNGMYLMKRSGMHIKRIAIAKKLHASEIAKLQEHELEKRERAGKDRMSNHVQSYVSLQTVIENLNSNDLRFASELIDRVAEPLLTFHKEMELKKKKIVLQEEKVEFAMKELKTKIITERKECSKQWTETSIAFKEWTKMAEECRRDTLNKSLSGKVEKLEKFYQGKREKLMKAVQKFEIACEAANNEQKIYWTKELPMIITTIELLEVERCNEFQLRMNELKRLEVEWHSNIPTIAGVLETTFNTMDVKKEMKAFVDSTVAQSGLPVAPPAFVPALAASSAQIIDDSPQLHQLLSNNPSGLITIANAAGGAPIDYRPAAPSTVLNAVAVNPDTFNRTADPQVTYVKALYDFNSEDEEDLKFNFHSIIKVLLKGEDVELAAEVERGEADEPRWWRGVQLFAGGGFSREGTFPSNYVVELPVDNDIALRQLLDIPSGFSCFSQFLRQEYSEENILFWSAVEKFRTQALKYTAKQDPEETNERMRAEMKSLGNEIATEFIGGSAPRQVNINGSTALTVWEKINTNAIKPSIFDQAQFEIMKMLAADSFTRFKRSELFIQYLASGKSEMVRRVD